VREPLAVRSRAPSPLHGAPRRACGRAGGTRGSRRPRSPG